MTLYIIGFVLMNVCFNIILYKFSTRYKRLKRYIEISAYLLSFFLILILIIQHDNSKEFLTKHWNGGRNGFRDCLITLVFPVLIYIWRITFLTKNKKIVKVCFCVRNKVEIFYKIIIAPICEEILFRNILLAAILENNGFMFAGFVVSLVFAISHLQYETFIYFFISSFAFSYIFWVSGSVLYTISSHIIYNLLCCLINVQVDSNT